MKYIKNRLFALLFFILIAGQIILSPIMWNITGISIGYPPLSFGEWINFTNFAFFIVLIGLLYEMYHPSLNFKLDKNKKWRAAGIFLLIVAVTVFFVLMFWQPENPGYSILNPSTFEFPRGSGTFYTLPTSVLVTISTLFMETFSFSLFFGILFMTKSTPQKSKSYKIMLFGAAMLELLFFMADSLFFISGSGMGMLAGKTRIQLLTTYWFHWDFWSELVIFIGAIWLLKIGKEFRTSWTLKEKKFVSIAVVLVLLLAFVVNPIAMGVGPEKIFASLIVFALAIIGFILYLKYTGKKKKRNR